jgi:hypothetical protein
MITFNVLTVTTFKSLLEKILEWRSEYHWKEHPSDDIKHRIRFDTPHLKEPLQYDMNILPKQEFMPYMHSTLEYIKLNIDDSQYDKFSEMEYEKFRRVVDYMENTTYSDQRLAEGMKDFYNWFNEYDIRRGTDFLETFPEYKNFYDMCKKYA